MPRGTLPCESHCGGMQAQPAAPREGGQEGSANRSSSFPLAQGPCAEPQRLSPRPPVLLSSLPSSSPLASAAGVYFCDTHSSASPQSRRNHSNPKVPLLNARFPYKFLAFPPGPLLAVWLGAFPWALAICHMPVHCPCLEAHRSLSQADPWWPHSPSTDCRQKLVLSLPKAWAVTLRSLQWHF